MDAPYIHLNKRYSRGEVTATLNPLIAEWFTSKFSQLTEPQSYAVIPIHERQNVVVSSPTGSGKTMTAFLSIINELMNLQYEEKLEERIYAVYVSPLRALANDINKNLNAPLQEISALASATGREAPRIRVAVRSGDTSSYERQKMVRTPPHILITTPESLALTISSPVFRTKFADVRWLILDELHEICDSKRGEFLSLTIERLAEYCNDSFTRIGLSATMAPIEEMAAFLGGFDRSGRRRPVSIVEVKSPKSLDLAVICPVRDLNAVQAEIANARMYDVLVDLIAKHRTTLVFTNTRSSTETVAYKLKERGVEGVEAHHGSLSRNTRKDVEDQLKRGELKCVITSTSLELGIDIGYIDLVCQIGSPKSVAKGLQRIGRSGHSRGALSRGRLLAFDIDDLVECAVLTRAAILNRIDRVDIPRNSLDVLAQTIVGMSLEKKWGVEEAFEVVRRSYCYHTLTRKDFISVLRYLGSKGDFENIYSKIWYDEREGTFGKKKSARLIYFLNIGTIPEESSYQVVTEKGAPVGQLSDKFVERLSQGDIFVLGGRSYEFIRNSGLTVLVKDAKGRKPNVPSWTGEMLPRSFDLSEEVGRFRSRMDELLERSEEEILKVLVNDYNIDEYAARSILNYFREQKSMIPVIPTDRQLLIEGIYDGQGEKRTIVFHFPFGRRTNDALSRAYAHAISEKYRCNASVSISDDNFLITVPRHVPLERLHTLVGPEELREVLMRSLSRSELFKQRFRHVASRSFMILRNYMGKESTVSRQQLRSASLLEQLGSIEDFPVVKETYSEIMNEVMDLEHAKLVLSDIEKGKRSVHYSGYSDTPSSFSHGILLSSISDIILMEDKSSMLRELHRKVLSKVMGKNDRLYEFESEVVDAYFAEKRPQIEEMEEVPGLLHAVGPLIMLKQRGLCMHLFTRKGHEEIRTWASELLRRGAISTVWLDDVYFVESSEVPYFAAISSRKGLRETESKLLDALAEGEKGARALSQKTGIEIEQINEALHRLELMFMVCRCALLPDGGWIWKRIDPPQTDREKALTFLLMRQLEYFGPHTAEELSFRFRNAEIVKKAEEMVEEGSVARGFFIPNEVEQYMLSKDYLRLKNQGALVFDYSSVQRYRQLKSLERLPSIEAYFKKFGEAGMMLDVFNRVEHFDRKEWEKMRREGRILLGRFSRGRVRYVMREDAPLYISAFRDSALSEEEVHALAGIREMGSGTAMEIAGALHMERERCREIIERLDRALWLHRLFQEGEEWNSRNIYAPLEIEGGVQDAREHILSRIISSQGPVRISDVRYQTGFWDTDLEEMAERLGAVRIIAGDASNVLYIMKEELPALEHPEAEGKSTALLSMLDPLIQPMWAEIASRYGEGWYYPVVRDGKVCGMAEVWNMASCVEIRQLNLSEGTPLPDVLECIERMRKLYMQFGTDIARIREINHVPPAHADRETVALCRKAGFPRINDMFVGGEVFPYSFDERRLHSLVIERQHIGEQFGDVHEAVSCLMFLRSTYEGRLRISRFLSLEHEFREGRLLLVHSPAEFAAYTDMRWASVFRAARGAALTRHESHVLQVIGEMEPASSRQVLSASNIGRAQTIAALKTLFKKGYIALDGRRQYVTVRDNGMQREEALRNIAVQYFAQFGVMTAEKLSRFTGRMSIRRIRELLRELEGEGKVKKGYLQKGSDTLYWMDAHASSRIGRANFSRDFIATQEDRLVLYFREEVRSRFGLGASNIIFSGGELSGAFRGKIRDNEVSIEKFEGSEDAKERLAQIASEMGIVFRKKERPLEEEWNVVDFYERTHPGR